MVTIGQMLRDERRRQNRTIGDIASVTCISSRYLDAIERDRLEEIPGEFFARSYVRQYARALGLDLSPLSKQLEHETTSREDRTLSILSATYRPPGSEPRPPRVWLRLAVAFALLVTALIGGGALYARWLQSEEAASIVPHGSVSAHSGK